MRTQPPFTIDPSFPDPCPNQVKPTKQIAMVGDAGFEERERRRGKRSHPKKEKFLAPDPFMKRGRSLDFLA